MKYIKYIFLFFLSSQVHSQYVKQIELDSLIAQRKSGKINIEGRVKLFEELYIENFFKNKSIAMKYNDSLYSVSKKYGLKSAMGSYYQNIAFEKFTLSEYYPALRFCKKASKIFLEDNNHNAYLSSIARQCVYLNYLNRTEESFQLALRNINLYKNHTGLAALGELYLHISEYYLNNKKYNNALLNTKIALNIFQTEKSYIGIVECDLFMGAVYFELEKYSEAIKYFNRLINLPEEVKDNDAYKYIYYSYMTETYCKMNKYQETIRFSKKAISYFKKAKLGLYVIEMQLYMADAYQRLGNNRDAKKVIQIVEKNINKYLSEPDIDKSVKHLNQIKSNIFYNNKQYELALQMLQKNLNFKDVDIKIYQDISNIQFKLRRYKSAFENLKLYNKYKIEQLTLHQKNNLNELEVIYDSKDKEFKIKDLKIKALKKDLEIENQKQSLRNLIIVSGALLIIIIFVLYIYRIRIKVSQILKYKNEKLESINKLLNKSIGEKEILLKEIHHRVKNNLQLVSSILNIQANDSPNISVAEFLDKCQNRISSIALIHKNLYITENVDKVDFQEYVQELSNSIIESFVDKESINYEIKANNNRFNIQTSISLGLIISELSCNSIKHAFKDKEEGSIYLEINQLMNNKYELIFGDNGCGNNVISESSISIGLELVNLLALQLNGSLVKLERQGTFYKIFFEEVT